MRLTSKLHHASFVSSAPINRAINIPATVLTAPITTEKISEKLPHNPTANIFVSPNCPIIIWSTIEKENGIESGERLELKSFYRDNTKLSIGMEGDAGYYPDGTRSLDVYDYDNDYMEDGVSYLILEETKTTKYVFGVAWIEKVTAENDVQTWFGADPTLF